MLTFYADFIWVSFVASKACANRAMLNRLAFSIDSTSVERARILALFVYACKGGGLTISVNNAFRSGSCKGKSDYVLA